MTLNLSNGLNAVTEFDIEVDVELIEAVWGFNDRDIPLPKFFSRTLAH